MRKFFCAFIAFFPLSIWAEKVDTFYSALNVNEPVLLELINCSAMQRLKDVRQYGVVFYTTNSDPYNRYDHSLGVFAILRMKGASLTDLPTDMRGVYCLVSIP